MKTKLRLVHKCWLTETVERPSETERFELWQKSDESGWNCIGYLYLAVGSPYYVTIREIADFKKLKIKVGSCKGINAVKGKVKTASSKS